MKMFVRRCGLTLLAMLPISAVSFAARSSLNIAQIGISNGVSDAELQHSTQLSEDIPPEDD